MNQEERTALKNRIATVLSEILSDKYECKVTLRFVPVAQNDEREN